MLSQLFKKINGIIERMDQCFERMEQRMTNIERSDRCSERECSVETSDFPEKLQALITEPQTELFILLPAEPWCVKR